MFFILDTLPSGLRIIFFLMILFCNVWFWSLWIYMVFYNSKYIFLRNIAEIFGMRELSYPPIGRISCIKFGENAEKYKERETVKADEEDASQDFRKNQLEFDETMRKDETIRKDDSIIEKEEKAG